MDKTVASFSVGKGRSSILDWKKAGIRWFLEMNQEQSDTENNPKDLWNAGCNQEDERAEG